MRIRTGLILAVAGATLTAACSGASGGAGTPTPAARASTSTPASAASSTARPAGSATTGAPTSVATATAKAAGSPDAAVVKVNANAATREEIQRALEAAGVPAAANWSREVVEYRPYTKDDTNWTKLRGELAKYNPAPGVVDQIVAVLEK